MTWAISLTLIALVVLSGGAYGITGNFQPDTTPYVCIVVLFGADQTSPIGYSSGVLISPTVVLTAGHSTLNAVTASVCFDKGPIEYSIKDGKIVYSGTETIYTGTPYTFQEYEEAMDLGLPNGSHLFASSDVGLIILDKEVDGIENFPNLPSAGFSDTLEAKNYLAEIGYGVQYQTTPRNDGVQNSWTGTISQNSAIAQLVPGNFAGNDRYLRLTANPSQDKGGVAFGDSGGPLLYQADDATFTVLAINAFVSNSNCAGVSYHTRIDTEQVLGWIQEKILENSGGEN